MSTTTTIIDIFCIKQNYSQKKKYICYVSSDDVFLDSSLHPEFTTSDIVKSISQTH